MLTTQRDSRAAITALATYQNASLRPRTYRRRVSNPGHCLDQCRRAADTAIELQSSQPMALGYVIRKYLGRGNLSDRLAIGA